MNPLNPFVLMSMSKFRKYVKDMNLEQKQLLIDYFSILLRTLEPEAKVKTRKQKIKLKDILHEIEICNLDALECYQLVKSLKRKIKIYRESVLT